VLPENDNGRPTVTRFLEETELTKKAKTLAAYATSTALNDFTESCPKLHLHEVERHDLLKFSGLPPDEKKQSPRSVLRQIRDRDDFLKANGIRGLLGCKSSCFRANPPSSNFADDPFPSQINYYGIYLELLPNLV
jgi:hypothetical protein